MSRNDNSENNDKSQSNTTHQTPTTHDNSYSKVAAEAAWTIGTHAAAARQFGHTLGGLGASLFHVTEMGNPEASPNAMGDKLREAIRKQRR